MTARVQCTVKGSPELHITWFMNDHELITGERHKITFKDGQAVLEINGVSVADTGNYTCEVLNEAGCESCSTLLTVKGVWHLLFLKFSFKLFKCNLVLIICNCVMVSFLFLEPPSFRRELKMVEVVRGTTAILECEVSGTPPFEVHWFKNKKAISTDKKYKVISQDAIARLEISSFESIDAGDYQCSVSNDVGKVSCASIAKLKG